MSLDADCPACIEGNHDRHDAGWGTMPGLIGGSVCVCSGECADRARVQSERMAALFKSMTVEVKGMSEHPMMTEVAIRADERAKMLAAIEQISYQPGVPCPDPDCDDVFNAVRLVDVYEALEP